MVTGVGITDHMEFRNLVMQLAGLASEFGTGTASSNAVTINTLIGQITTETLTTNGDTTATDITLTNNKIKSGDTILAVLGDPNNSNGAAVLQAAFVSADNTALFTIRNVHASQALNAAFTITFMVIKKLSGITPN